MHEAARHRVLVTGIGVESCAGATPDALWDALSTGRPAISALELEEPLPCKVGGVVKGFDPRDHMSVQQVRRTSRFQQLLFAAAMKARADAALRTAPGALFVGTGGGGLDEAARLVTTLRRSGWSQMNRLGLLRLLPNQAAGLIAQELDITGPVLTLSTACASSTDAIGAGLRAVRDGTADVVLVGGVESWLDLPCLASFCLLDALSQRPAAEAASASRPFDRDRDGMVPAEGAAVLVLESERSALRRGATVHGEVLGAASTCDAHHPLAPRTDGTVAARTIELACADAGLDPAAVDLVSAHGTSTPLNDRAETAAIKRAFGSHARHVAITAPKSVIGHACGACGILESVGVLLAMREKYVPPTANLHHPDPACDLDYTPLVGRSTPINVAVKQNFGFGGQNSAVVFGTA
ncbi:beta-ketoacyl-[acyl-carrier-protein] synthase family protein [Streptomyces sp. SCA3-4]|uniref:beta-ketoacyl-[acyl-carrier-protein] synthase family protein n=1 Tax=Streptomyces sichuanensis TaxID=2871810 RepID=UPI001CE35C4C|nr:beta-ketoacyl-[acyl-carrier-protein] synthase family protein [Streptomyces sichuanensis]MCA6092199.1 beta-ketoacyl-[acyl-carrier-protein] synthase family protein [Streptomyces sichuanensis]